MKIENVERSLTDLIARFAPWLSPLPTAYLTARATIVHLGWPSYMAAVAGLIIEFLGLGAVNTAMELYNYNRSRRKTDQVAPLWIALILTGIYFVSVTGLTFVLDTFPKLAIGAPLVFPLLSMAGMTVLALRVDHRRRLDAIQADRAERSGARRKARSATGQVNGQATDGMTGQGTGTVTGQVNGEAVSLANLNRANMVRRQSRDEALTALLTFLTANPTASFRQAGAAVGRSKSWAVGALGDLEGQGRVHRNGNGWEVAT